MDGKLCGFIWCYGKEDFALWETDAISNEDQSVIETILAKYEHTGSSARSCWDDRISELMWKEY